MKQFYKILEITKPKNVSTFVKYYLIKDILEVETVEDVMSILSEIYDERFTPVKSKDDGKKVFCYLRDFDVIYSCFKRYYNIDLISEELHYWKFKNLLNDLLTNENSLTKRIGYRGDIPDTKDDTLKNHYYKMQTQYRLEGEHNNLNCIFERAKEVANGR